MIKSLKENIIFIAILALITGVFFYYGHCKAGYYIDEIYTYGLSNSHYAPYLKDVAGGDLEDKIITNDMLKSYVTVDDGEVLDFGSVYYNQGQDVHPPLYYWLFNAVSSLTPNTFSKWTGLALEYLIFLGTLIVLAILCQELFSNRTTTYIALLLYGLSNAGISTAVYIRMYCLLTLETLLLAYCIVKLLRTKRAKYCISSGLCILCGMLTQYYFVIYAFFLSAAVCLYLIINRSYSLLWKYALAAFAGVGLMVLIFPASIRQIFVGNGQVVSGGVAVDNITNLSGWISRLSNYAHFVTHGIKVTVILGIIALVYLLITKQLKRNEEILVIGIPAIATWFLIALMAAVQEERYIYNILPIFVLMVAYLLNHLHISTAPLCCIAALSLAFTGCNTDYLQPRMLEVNSLLGNYSEDKCVYLEDNKFAAMTSDFGELINFKDVFTTSDASSNKMKEYLKNSDEVVVFIDTNAEWSSGLNPETEMQKMMEATGYTEYEKLLENTLSEVYILR